MSDPHRPPTTVGADPPEVKQYREDFESSRLGPPPCQNPSCKVNRCGVYDRTDARLQDGLVLAPIPIQRWRCRLHGTIPWLPGFLRVWGHYLASVVEAVLEEYARPELAPSIDRLNAAEGPAGITLRRWVTALDSCDTPALERELLQEGLSVPRLLPSLRWAWQALGAIAKHRGARHGVFASCWLRWFRSKAGGAT
jgi:hypothetical protein